MYKRQLFTLGRAAAAAGDRERALEAYVQLEALAGMGSSLVPIATADLEMYLGRQAEAIAVLEPAIEASENPFEKAAMLIASGEAQMAVGNEAAAVSSAVEASDLSEHESIQYLAARILMAAGEGDHADEIALDLENRLKSQTTALSALIRGERALDKGQLGTAMREFRFAREEFDMWFGHFLMGRAFFEAEQYPEALDEFDHCVRGKGEITDVFLVDSATVRYFPPALYWLARSHEALGNVTAAQELYREYVDLRGEADPSDLLSADAADRLARN